MTKEKGTVGEITPGQMSEFWRQVGIRQIGRDYFQAFLDHRLAERNLFLRLISGETLTIDATDGQDVLVDARDVFDMIDGDFKGWGADEPGQPTGETIVDVYEMIKNGALMQMFNSLSSDVRKLCLTQAQIKGFVKKHRQRPQLAGCAALFLFQSKKTIFKNDPLGDLFIASASFNSSGGLDVRVHRLENADVCHAGYRLRIVAPRLA